MLDINLFRPHQGGDIEMLRESQRRRIADVALIDEVVAVDAEWRRLQHDLDCTRKAQAERKRQARPKPEPDAGDPPRPTRSELAALGSAVADAERAAHTAQVELQSLLLRVGNIVHEHAPCASKGHEVPTDTLRRQLITLDLAESSPRSSDNWRARGPGLLLQHAWLASAMSFVAARGFEVLAEPLRVEADRLSKLAKLLRERGDPGSPTSTASELAATPLGALHACSSLQPSELPMRYAVLRTPKDGAAVAELWLNVVCADDGSCWDALEELITVAEGLHAELLGLSTQMEEAVDEAARPARISTAEVEAPRLAADEARAFVVCAEVSGGSADRGSTITSREDGGAGGGGGSSVVLARCSCEYDYVARRLGVRCGHPSLGDYAKRHVHSVSARLFQPSACLLALAAIAPKDGSPLDALPAPLRDAWLPSRAK